MKARRIVGLVVLLGLFSVVISAQESIRPKQAGEIESLEAVGKHEDRGVLKGLSSVSVLVGIQGDVASDEARRLQAAIELRLRTNGVPVKEGSPTLIFAVIRLDPEKGTAGSALTAELFEPVIVKRNGVEAIRQTWAHRGLWWMNPATKFDRLRDITLEIADEFSNDYLAANPK